MYPLRLNDHLSTVMIAYFRFLFLILLGSCLLQGCTEATQSSVNSVKFGLLSDIHLPTMHDSERRMTTFIDSMLLAQPDFIVELGDLVTPAPKYQSLMDIWMAYPGEKYHVIGNHEMDGGYGLDEVLVHRKMDKSYYHFERNGFNFIVLDGNDKKFPEETGYRNYIGPDQQAWLKQTLSRMRGPVVILSHQAIGPVGGIDNAEEIRAILEDHNNNHAESRVFASFNGHLHYDAATALNGIWYVHINSASYFWMGDEYQHIRYSEEVDEEFKWIKYTAPYKDPLYAIVEISSDGIIQISGKTTTYVGPSPWEVGYPDKDKDYIRPAITSRKLIVE
jgi:3',5'-cyclic-AMP phosphodiesterase